MGAAVRLSWKQGRFDCHLRMEENVHQIKLVDNGVVVASATVPSASAAFEWAAERGASQRPERDRPARTG